MTKYHISFDTEVRFHVTLDTDTEYVALFQEPLILEAFDKITDCLNGLDITVSGLENRDYWLPEVVKQQV